MVKKLFAVYIGGMIEGCNVELHDVRFVAGATIEDCHDALRRQWWGSPESLHLDAWGVVDWVDGHSVSITDAPGDGLTDQRLWFVNLGGYDSARFEELHYNSFVVAKDWRAAKRKAMEAIRHWESPHKDAVLDVDAMIDLSADLLKEGVRIVLAASASRKEFSFEARYAPVGRLTQ